MNVRIVLVPMRTDGVAETQSESASLEVGYLFPLDDKLLVVYRRPDSPNPGIEVYQLSEQQEALCRVVGETVMTRNSWRTARMCLEEQRQLAELISGLKPAMDLRRRLEREEQHRRLNTTS